jgi:hypothetical protein
LLFPGGRGAASFPVGGKEPENVLTKLLLNRFRLILGYSGQKNTFLKIIYIFILIFGTVSSFSNPIFFQNPGEGAGAWLHPSPRHGCSFYCSILEHKPELKVIPVTGREGP